MSTDTNDSWGAGSSSEDFDNLLDSKDVDQEKLEDAIRVQQPGMYHFEVEHAKERFEGVTKSGQACSKDILLTLIVLESVDGQAPAGAVTNHSLVIVNKDGEVTDFHRESLLRFLLACGLCERNEDGEIIDPATGTTKIQVSSLAGRLLGRQVMGEVKAEKDTDKDGKEITRYGFPYNRGFYNVADPRVANAPKNWEAAKLYGVEPPKKAQASAASSNGTSSAKDHPPTPAKAQQQPTRRTTKPAAKAEQAPSAAQAPANVGGDDNYDDL